MSKIVEIMPCLDMQAGRVVKGVHFVDIADAGDPVECAKAYCAAGADQLALLDITATVENRGTLVNVVRDVAAAATVPFTVGGGISDLKSAEAVLSAGADKISTSSAAFCNPDLIPALIREFGADKLPLQSTLTAMMLFLPDTKYISTAAEQQPEWMRWNGENGLTVMAYP